jgi:IS30 family transposase
MKAQHNNTQIALLLGRDKPTIMRELRRNAECRGYKAKQAYELACKGSESSLNASTLSL